MARADSARTGWFPAILLVRAGPADRAPVEVVAGREAVGQEAEQGGLARLAAVVGVLAALLVECLEAEEVVAPAVEGAAD